LKYHGEFGVEAQIFENSDLLVGLRFETRQLAVNWAMPEKEDIEKGADVRRFAVRNGRRCNVSGSGTGIRTPVPWLRTTCPDP
jgi:hypothetical protein